MRSGPNSFYQIVHQSNKIFLIKGVPQIRVMRNCKSHGIIFYTDYISSLLSPFILSGVKVEISRTYQKVRASNDHMESVLIQPQRGHNKFR